MLLIVLLLHYNENPYFSLYFLREYNFKNIRAKPYAWTVKINLIILFERLLYE